jgi:two-component system, NtrC family, sensor histidine kinase PilS
MLFFTPDPIISESYWRSFRYFNVYRLIIALLLALVGLKGGALDADQLTGGDWLYAASSVSYVLICAAALLVLWQTRRRFHLYLSLTIGIDTIFLLTMLHASGGLRSGLGVLLLVSLAAAGLVGQGRLVLSYAAFATIGLLLQQTYQGLLSEFDDGGFFRAGLFSLGFFATAISARLLARRVLTSEELAQRRGRDLSRQLKLTNHVIAMLDDGVLAVSPSGQILQANPRARAFLSIGESKLGSLGSVWPELGEEFLAWQTGGLAHLGALRFGSSGLVLSVRFLPVDVAGGDSLIFLQDLGRQRELAQRLKLAALGRLTANIAHEIRNPLSSIRHATELLAEENHDRSDRRLLQIILDNTQRLDGIVTDVLELGRRDRVERKAIKLAEFLPGFVQQFEVAQKIESGRITIKSASSTLLFDVTHLHQVLWNLVANAIRYASVRPGAVTLEATLEEVPLLSVRDDGPGVPEDRRAQLFEPFVTTHAQGSGLGLFIARELCEANGATLEYRPCEGGACFVVRGEA